MYYGIDVTTLRKGTTITPVEIEKILGVPRNHRDWALSVLYLGAWIEHQLKDINGATVAMVKGALRIQTDAEAHSYTWKQHWNGYRKIRKNLRRAQRIDGGNLTRDELQEHDRRTIIQGRMFQALKKAARAVEEAKELYSSLTK